MASKHAGLVADARAAIDKVYSDTSVSHMTSLESMEELQEFIEENIRALRDTAEDLDDLEADR